MTEASNGCPPPRAQLVWQTAVNPVVAPELLTAGIWQGSGVLGPEAFAAVPFLDLLTAYGAPWGLRNGG